MRREIPGPSPQQFGIIAKQEYDRTNANRNLKNKQINDERADFIKNNKNDISAELKINFFEDSNKKSRVKQVNREVAEIMNQRNFLLFERRKKLKMLLIEENQTYEDEFMASAKTPLERQAELRERAKQIRARGANEQAEFVQKKLDQKFRAESDELRTYQSKALQAGMGYEHMRQVEEKIFKEREKLEEEAIFADMWFNDIQAKKDKEDQQAKKVYQRNRDVAAVLKEQMQVLEDQKFEENRLRVENSRLLAEKQNIEKLEKQFLFQKKRENQAIVRHELDQCIKARLINEAKRAKEEMAYDLKALEDSLISFQNEDLDRAKRKQELMKEEKYYQDYLKEQYAEEKRRAKELDSIIMEEIEKQMQKRLDQWKAEKQARKALLQKTLQERHLQIVEKIIRNQEREKELEIEKFELNKLMEFHKQQEKEEKLYMHQKVLANGQDLRGQIQYNSMQRDLINKQDQDEYQSYVRAEAEYNRKLNEKIDSIKPTNYKY